MRLSLPAAFVGLCLFVPVAAHAAILLQDFDGNGVTTGNAGLIFRAPSFSGSTSSNVANSSTSLSTDKASSGTQSLKVEFDWTGNGPNLWDRLTTSGADPVISATDVLTMRIFNDSADPISIAAGIREVTYAADPAIGSKGTGTSTGLEFIGALGTTSGAPNAIHTIAPGSWQDLTFDPTTDPITSFVGNGVLNPTFGKVNLEQLAIRSPGTGGHVRLFIDDIRVATHSEVPEPGTLALLGTGLLPLLGLRRRRA